MRLFAESRKRPIRLLRLRAATAAADPLDSPRFYISLDRVGCRGPPSVIRAAASGWPCDARSRRLVGRIADEGGHLGGRPMGRMINVLALAGISAVAMTAASLAETSGKKIAFSNNYAGNSWRQAMLKSYDLVTKKAVTDKIVAAADIFTTADKEVPTQAGADPEPYPAGLRRHRHQRRVPGRSQRLCQAGLRCGDRGRLIRRDRHRALRLPRRRRLQGHG